MKAASIMLIAGEASGDRLAAEMVRAFRARPGGAGTRFFGAGGPEMQQAGVELAFDLTQHSVIGLWEALRHYRTFKRLFDALLKLALERRPDLLVCVDFSGFNRRFAAVLRWELRVRAAELRGWRPRIVQFVSPQVWASRPGRARTMERDLDLLLSIFPFEKAWYAQHAPRLPVEFVGHPMLDRYESQISAPRSQIPDPKSQISDLRSPAEVPVVVLLPGSRVGELRRHLPVMLPAIRRIEQQAKARFCLVLAHEALAGPLEGALLSELGQPLDGHRPASLERVRGLAHQFSPNLTIELGAVGAALQQATLALASTGTVTMECAFFRVPTVTLYKTGWSTYQIGKRIITVPSLTMPNLLAGEVVFPEFVQDEATPEHLATAALALLNDEDRRKAIRAKLDTVLASLGGPGATRRAVEAIGKLMG